MTRLAIGMVLVVVGVRAQVVPLTSGPGNDTEAAWSPDGRSIVFQREADGEADIHVFDVATGKARALVAGSGDARYPCWSPDGKTIVYSFGHIVTTAHQGIPNGYGLFSISLGGGTPTRLTSGQVRDYTPTFTGDGTRILFASTRGLQWNDAALQSLELGSGEIKPVLRFGSTNMGAVSPAVSPDGRLLAFAAEMGLRSNWQIMLARMSDPSARAPLTERAMSMYSPRWSPDGETLACTGYRVGDPGWGLYLIRVRDGALARLDTGEGNARSPAWSPDGTSLVFENNRTGLYKLYRIPVGTPTFGPAQEWLRPPPATPLVRLRLSDLAEGKCPDLIGHGHDAVASGDVPKLADGGVQCGEGFARIDGHGDFAFDRQAFYVTADVFIEKNPKKLQLIVVGDYPEHHLGWQLYVDPNGRGCFSSRDPAGTYVGARTEAPIPAGKRITMTGVRDSRGTVSLLVRGEMEEDAEAIGATMAYGPPNQIRIGSQFNGGDRFQGRLYEVEVGTGIPAEKRKRMLTVKEVLGE